MHHFTSSKYSSSSDRQTHVYLYTLQHAGVEEGGGHELHPTTKFIESERERKERVSHYLFRDKLRDDALVVKPFSISKPRGDMQSDIFCHLLPWPRYECVLADDDEDGGSNDVSAVAGGHLVGTFETTNTLTRTIALFHTNSRSKRHWIRKF